MSRVRIGVTIAVGLSLAIFIFQGHQSLESRARTDASRRIMARVVGEEYAPRRIMRGSNDDRTDVLATVAQDAEPHDRGRARLLAGEVSDAIADLRQAASGGDAVALNDLAAALVTEGERRSAYAPDVEAIAVATKALERDPDLAAAHFNLALALEQVGLITEASAELREAARLDARSGWTAEARDRAKELLHGDLGVDRGPIDRYVEATADPAAKDVLRPYLIAQRRRLGRPASPVSNARLSLAAATYGVGSAEPVVAALQTLCRESEAEPCAVRYSKAGALFTAGRSSEAAAWLRSVDADIDRGTGAAGLAAQRVWEQGLRLVITGRSEEARGLFYAAYASSAEARERRIAAMFDDLAREVRTRLMEEASLHGDVAAAFRYADGSSLDEVQRALAPDAAILRYTALNDQIVVFVVRSDSADFVTLPGSVRQVGSTEARMRSASDAYIGLMAAQLHDLVFLPVAAKLTGISTLAIVSDRELAEIPFGALFDKDRGEYLLERFTIVHAPSARSAVESSRRAREARDPTLLAIGATEFDHAHYQKVDVLPDVEREIADIARQSLCARVFAGSQATPEAIQRALAESAVVHYAGHIVRRGADPRLLLAPSRGRDALSAAEIAAFRLEKPRVVVLAGCGGAAIGEPHAPIPTMAQAFLLAGVPTVIATSYDVDDALAPATMILLHSFLANGEDAAEALRKTARAELQSGHGVPLAIRFQAIGGTSSLVQ